MARSTPDWIRRSTGSPASRLAAVMLAPALVVAASVAHAQPAPAVSEKPTFYFGGSVAAASRPPALSMDYHYTDTVGGTTADVIATAGAFLTTGVSAGAEITFGSVTGPLVFNQHNRYHSATATYRETLCSFFLRRHARGGRVQLEPIGAVVLQVAHVTFANVLEGDSPGWPQSEPLRSSPDSSFTSFPTFGVGGGIDVLAPLGRQFTLNALFRYYWVDRHQSTSEPGFVGLSNHTFQVGAGLRWTASRKTAPSKR